MITYMTIYNNKLVRDRIPELREKFTTKILSDKEYLQELKKIKCRRMARVLKHEG